MKRLLLSAVAISVLSVSALANHPSVRVGQFGSWTVYIATDEMSDQQWYGALVQSDGSSLHVECSPFKPTELVYTFISSERFIGLDSRPHNVTYRVDKQRAQTDAAKFSGARFNLTCAGDCLKENPDFKNNVMLSPYISTDTDPNELLSSQIKDGAQLLVEVMDYSKSVTMMRFHIDGARDALKAVSDGCKRLHSDPKNKHH